MDTEEAREILDDGKTNALTSTGTLINHPSCVIQLYFNGEEYPLVFGSFGLQEDGLDYAIHREKDIPLREKESYYENNNVEAEVYTLDGETVNVKRFEATPDGWEVIEE